MEAKHTRWEWRPTHTGEALYPVGSTTPVLCAYLSKDEHGAAAVLSVLDEARPLLSAAPDLAEALQDAMVVMSYYITENSPPLVKARSALARAKVPG